MQIKRILLALACVSLVACGSGVKVAEKKKGPQKENDGNKNDQKACPATPPSAMHRITLRFAGPMPSHMGLKLETDADFRLSDCAQTSQRGVTASWTKEGANKLVIQVAHNSFYNNALPPVVGGLELYDLQNCGASAGLFFKTTAPIRIDWRSLPVSPTCTWTTPVGEANFQALTEADVEQE